MFTDPALASHAGRFVWLEIDVEKAGNAALRKRLQISVLPTYFVLDPADERAALRWVGGATAPQLARLLDDGREAVAGGGELSAAAGGRGPGDPAGRALARADSLFGRAEYAAAAAAYQEALASAPGDWPRTGRGVESLLFCLYETRAWEAGARLALEAWPRLRRSPSAANLAATGLGCALRLPAEHPGRQALVDSLEAVAGTVARDGDIPVAADDRSGVHIALLDVRKAAKDSLGARAAAEAWAGFLEAEAARADSPEGRAVFDSHRLSAYLELGEPQRAVPMLSASERDLPGDYNPPARLAMAYKAMRRWREALAASDRAMALAYGPRKLLYYRTRADIYLGMADSTGARRTLAEAIRYAESLPPGQRSETTIGSLKQALAALQ